MNNTSQAPHWFDETRICIEFDARPILAAGGHPVADVLQKTAELNAGDIMVLITPFPPMPLIDKVKDQGFEVYGTQKEGLHYNYFCKP